MADKILAEDADLGLMQDRQVAVLGFGAMGAAHALNLRDSGVDVRVGLPEDSRARVRAEIEGLTVLTPQQACADADLVALLEPDHRQAQVYADAVAPHLQEGDALLFSRGWAIRFGQVSPPRGVDVLMVAAQADGHLVRREYTDGRGVPCLLAVEQDASGVGWDLAAAYAAGIGGLRVGGLRTTFAAEAEARAFGQHAVQDGVAALVEAGYGTLVDAGYPPEVAYLACLHELKDMVDQLYVGGLASQRGPGGDAASDGVIDAAVRQRMAHVLEQVRRGERDGDRPAGVRGPVGTEQPRTRRRAAAQAGSIEQIGREVRSMMSWIRA